MKSSLKLVGTGAVIVTAAVALWFVFRGAPQSGDDAHSGLVAAERLDATGALETEDTDPAALAAQSRANEAASQRQAVVAQHRLVRGRLVSVSGDSAPSLRLDDGAGRVSLVKARTKTLDLRSLLSSTDLSDFKKLEPAFEPRKPVAATVVAPDGTFDFVDPPSGRFELRFSHALLRLESPPVFKLGETEHKDLGAVPVVPAGSLVVFVADSTGKPVDGASLELSGSFDPTAFADPEKLLELSKVIRRMMPAKGRTDSSGVFRFGGVAGSGAYALVADAPSYPALRRTVQLVDGMQTVLRLRFGVAAKLRVHVLDMADGAVQGAHVRVSLVKAPPHDTRFPAARIRDRRAKTDRAGQAVCDGVPAGVARIHVRAPGYLPASVEKRLVAGETVEVEVRLDRGASVAGRVVDETGAPIAGARVANAPMIAQSFMGVEIGSVVPPELLAAGAMRSGTETDATGAFELTGLPRDKLVHLVALAKNHTLGRLGPLDPGTKGHVVEVQALGTVHGRIVREEDGKPVRDCRAWCSRTQYLVLEGKLGKFSIGDPDAGAFVLALVPQGTQTLVVEAPGRTSLRKQIEVGRGDTDLGELRMGPVSAIAGVVVDKRGAPIEKARVRLARGGMADFEMLAKIRGQAIAVTDASGKFRLEGVPARRVKLLAEKKGYAVTKSRIVRVALGQTTEGVHIELDDGGAIEAFVVDADGQPLAGCMAQIASPAVATVRSAHTDQAGRFRAAGLAPGLYQVQVFPSDWMKEVSKLGNERRKSGEGSLPDMSMVMKSMRRVLQTKVSVRSGKTSEVKLVAETAANAAAATRLSGTVRIGGEPVASGFVELLELGGTPRVNLATVRSGAFEFSGLQPGVYRARVRTGLVGAALWIPKAIRVDKGHANIVKLDLPGGRIAGRVVSAKTGEPLPHILVRLSSKAESRQFNPQIIEDLGQGIWMTDAKGRFSFDGLRAGRYSITARELSFSQASSGSGRVSGLVLEPGGRRDDVDVRLGLGGSIHVRVVSARGATPNATVRLLDATGAPVQMFQPQVTDTSGVATLSSVPAGAWRVLVDVKTTAPTVSDGCEVRSEAESSVELRVQPGVDVYLTVDGDLPDARPGELLVFSVWDHAGKLLRAGPAPLAQLYAKADQARRGLHLGAFRPGGYRVRVESASLGVLQAEQEVPEGSRADWTVNLATRTIQRR